MCYAICCINIVNVLHIMFRKPNNCCKYLINIISKYSPLNKINKTFLFL